MNSPSDTQPPSADAPQSSQTAPRVMDSPSNEGQWAAISATLAGAPVPDAVTDSISMKMDGGQYEVNVGGQPDKGTYTVDRTSSPYRITITGTDGPNAGKTLLAIFDFPDDEQMRVSYDLTGAAFPTEFESTADNKLFLVTYKRSP